ncbi:pH-response regulator protein palH/rim21 [Zalaria obscura]|uniref:PH-response regulator protein palH/rim21 n=1 Tax=Zalaria obscura TaxID=2024903 RepID=A0ACC3SPT3_9PEZI
MGSLAGTPSFGTGRGIIGGANGGSGSLIGVGSRPWLQKVAALTVAVSLTIATADTFKVARQQYLTGYMDANALRDQVLGSLEIRITRVISDVFLWLAQVQTLIRLFPRHKEKVLIKWIGFALTILDSTFSCLNSFLVNSSSRPRHFEDAIPALSYLFQLALGLLYAAWVIYYSLTKRRYAFYHPRMPNICLIALLSLVAILTPVVFFITDVSQPDVAGWGDYFRWVGAAAASVVVWEWVERIEALERDEKKDGILGREIFDGDEMLDLTPSEEVTYNRKRRDSYHARRGGDSRSGTGEEKEESQQSGFSGMPHFFKRNRQPHPPPREHFPLGRAHSNVNEQRAITFGNLPRRDTATTTQAANGITSPPRIVSPPSRTDTTSAASTVYVVHYHPVADTPQPSRRRPNSTDAQRNSSAARAQQSQHTEPIQEVDEQPSRERTMRSHWQSVPNPFKRKRGTPPAEVRAATREDPRARRNSPPQIPAHNYSRWDVKARLGAFAADQGEKLRDRRGGRKQEVELPWIVIPAQPRGHTWSPDVLDTQGAKDSVEESPTRSSGHPQQHAPRRQSALRQDSEPSQRASQQSQGSSSATAVEQDATASSSIPTPARSSAVERRENG